MGQGNFSCDRWWLIKRGKEPVAVAMLSDVPDLQAWDLSYLGVVPEARRQGVGKEVTLHLLHYARACGAPGNFGRG